MKALTRLIQTTRRFSASSVCMRSEGVWQQKGVPGKATRGFSTSATRKSAQAWQQRGVPGATLPVNINNRYSLLGWFIVFFGSGLAAPFIIVRYQMLKD
ncbi:hypothetical protein NP493_48g04033 [Ridgeia piscesae]|uniref:Cytochrome c oxidase subunit 7C, mitochondrial n=1 Tax=Ridgeia piscesae TaxID=27915 RepID=A0AAD9PBB3_RIDPI|nr:hypothetical protein NP493_48g04033 [Ridgeia piscesae]